MLDWCDRRVRGTDHHRQATRFPAAIASNRSRTGSRSVSDERQRNGRHLREPRDLTVPFPFRPLDRGRSGQNDFDNSSARAAALNQQRRGDPEGRPLIPRAPDYQRSARTTWPRGAGFRSRHPLPERGGAGPGQPDRDGVAARRPEPSSPASSWRYDMQERRVQEDLRDGAAQPREQRRHPGIRGSVVLSGDDTFVTQSDAQSQLYIVHRPDTDALWNDEGTLYAFVADRQDELQLQVTTPTLHRAVPRGAGALRERKATATAQEPTSRGGRLPELRRHRPPACPMDRSGCSTSGGTPRTTRTARTSSTSCASRTSRTTANDPNVVYLADSGRGSRGTPARRTCRRTAGSGDGPRPERSDQVTSLTILIEGDDSPVKTLDEIHQPDNLETTTSACSSPRTRVRSSSRRNQ